MAKASNQKELVRLLYLEHGHQKASQLSGVNYDLVRQWAHRGNWTPARNQAMSQDVTKTVADNVAATLAARKQESRARLSEYQVRAATEAAAHAKPLSITRQVNDLASIHSKVWPEEQGNAAQFSLNVLNINMFSDTDTPSLDV